MIRVVIVDDQLLICQGFQTLLDLEDDIQVVGLAHDGHAALAAVEQEQPDVVLMDVRMPELDGVAATRQITQRFPQVAVIILTTFDDDEYVFEGLKAGARGYLLKDISSTELIQAVRTVAAGQGLMQPSIARKVFTEFSRLAAFDNPARETTQPAASSLLTERESDVLSAMNEGLSNREIAARLVISEGTVKTHVSNILGKLEVRDRTQAIVKARTLGLVQ
jgi:DNA-binding NarL/FixJ family response regulator